MKRQFLILAAAYILVAGCSTARKDVNITGPFESRGTERLWCGVVKDPAHREILYEQARALEHKIHSASRPMYGHIANAFDVYVMLGDRAGAERMANVMAKHYPRDGAKMFQYIEKAFGTETASR